MADLGSIVKGTLSSIGKKAKDAAESGAVRDTYDRGVTAARCYADIAKLSLRINGEIEEQNRLFTEIGRLCYDLNRSAPDGSYSELFEKVKEKDELIDRMRSELEAAKKAVKTNKE